MADGSETLRLFVAVMAPPTVQAVATDLQAKLRATARPVRWSDPSSTHITLQFLGATAPERLPALRAALAGVAAGRRTMTLRTAEPGVFPNPSRTRVIWLGLTGDVAQLAALQAAVVAATGPLGFVAEVRAFTPHLTLGRVRDEATTTERAAIAAAVASSTPPAPAIWPVDDLRLMSSTLARTGATYQVVECWRFRAMSKEQ